MWFTGTILYIVITPRTKKKKKKKKKETDFETSKRDLENRNWGGPLNTSLLPHLSLGRVGGFVSFLCYVMYYILNSQEYCKEESIRYSAILCQQCVYYPPAESSFRLRNLKKFKKDTIWYPPNDQTKPNQTIYKRKASLFFHIFFFHLFWDKMKRQGE